jgi:formamidopyrimidine-DNA glycosylase
MPEGPEVSIITKGLSSVLKGKYLYNIEITKKSRYRDKAPDGFIKLKTHLSQNLSNSSPPIKIKDVFCKGKLIYFELDNNIYILNRLGMSGIWSHQKGKHTSIVLHYNTRCKSSSHNKLYFIDARHFGIMKIVYSKRELNTVLGTIGPDLLNSKVSLRQFKTILEKHKEKNICKVLMDQTILSGIGNYLKAEILYDSKISPHNKVGAIPKKALERLYKSSIRLIRESFLSAGNSLQYYKNVNTSKGTYEFKLKVYGKKRDPYNNKVIRVNTLDGRNTYYVPSLQQEFN